MKGRPLAANVAKALRSAWSSGATAIAVIASGVALAFSAWPALRPDPRDVQAARMQVATVEPAVTFGEFLERKGEPPPEGAGGDDLRRRGYVIYVRIQIEGRKHGSLRLDKVQYRVPSGRRLADQGPTGDAYFRPDTPNDQWIDEVFVDDPLDRQFIRLKLFDGRSLLAYADTPPIKPLAGPR